MVEYNLGDATITQSIFPEDSLFRNMPVRLNGIIAVPAGEVKPHPVVVILLALAMALPGPDKWFKLHITDPMPLVQSLKLM